MLNVTLLLLLLLYELFSAHLGATVVVRCPGLPRQALNQAGTGGRGRGGIFVVMLCLWLPLEALNLAGLLPRT